MNKLYLMIQQHKASVVVFLIFALVLSLLFIETTLKSLYFLSVITFLLIFIVYYYKYNKLMLDNQDKAKELKIYQKLIRNGNYYLHLDDSLHINYTNNILHKFIGVDNTKILGKHLFDIFDIQGKDQMLEILESHDVYSSEVLYKKNGDSIRLDMQVKKAPNNSGSAYFVLLETSEDVMKTQSQIRDEILRDTLTLLPTRLKLLNDIANFSKNSVFNKSTLMYVSIDNFDGLNEFFGMQAGNMILMKTAQWLQKDLPSPRAKLYKIDFNHFAIMVPYYMNNNDLEKYVRKLTVNLTREQFSFEESSFNIDITVGVAKGSHGELIKNAYLALKEAEKSKKAYKIYSKSGMHEERFLKNMQINKMVKEAIEKERVEPFFQAIYNIHTNEIEKYESLMRIKQEDDSYARPADFLDVAKRSKLYIELSKEMIKKCFEQLHNVKYPITINISAEDMLDPRMANFILRNLSKHGFGQYITFEILEDDDIVGDIKIKNFIKKLKTYGCKIAIDDFGSGFSNFTQLQQLNVDFIKIDGSLIKNIDKSKESEIMTRTIIYMAKELNIQTIAEFVSSKAIYNKVKSLGIDYAQGHFIDRADPVLLKNI